MWDLETINHVGILNTAGVTEAGLKKASSGRDLSYLSGRRRDRPALHCFQKPELWTVLKIDTQKQSG